MPSSVTSDVDLAERGEPDRRLDADLAGVGEHDDPAGAGDHRPLGGGLVAVGRGEAVLDGDAVGAEERDVGAQLGRAPRPCRRRPRPGWSGGPGRAAGAARSAGCPASRAATGTAWVTTVSRWSRGSRLASRLVVDPASSRTVDAGGGSRSRAALAIRSFSRGVGRVALAEPGLDDGEGARPARRRRAPGGPGPSARGRTGRGGRSRW